MPQGYSTEELVNMDRVYTKMGKTRRRLIPLWRAAGAMIGALLSVVTALWICAEGLHGKALLGFILRIMLILFAAFLYHIGAWQS